MGRNVIILIDHKDNQAYSCDGKRAAGRVMGCHHDTISNRLGSKGHWKNDQWSIYAGEHIGRLNRGRNV